MTSVVSLQLESGDLTDQLTKLFPKCRPRDLNLNPVQDELDNSVFMMDLNNKDRCERDEGVQDEDDDENRSQDNDETSSDEDFNNEEDLVIDHTLSGPEGQVIVLQSSKGATYKLRDSRIIEIAGGRELFSQSRSKAVRNKPRSDVSSNSQQQKKDVWETRNNNREITETVFSTEIHSVKHQRSSNSSVAQPQQQQPAGQQLSAGNGGSVSEVVVFDDIGDENQWSSKERRSEQHHMQPSDYFKVCSSLHDGDSDVETSKGPRVIGNLPIAEYEGSPRRYAPRQHNNSGHPVLPSAHSLLASPSVYPPRPGFPQRVMPSANNSNTSVEHNHNNSSSRTPATTTTTATIDTTTNNSSTFDYLYEFSETRKVLEEFFKQTENDSKTQSYQQEFDDLSYDLKRQAGHGSAYVGLRLAKGVAVEHADQDSPHKLCNNIESQNSMTRDHDCGEHENNFLDLSAGSGSTEDLGDTEVGLQVGHSRNFTLSPETTDCDSNCGDLDSEVSLLMMETDLAEAQSMQGNGDMNDHLGTQGGQDSLRIYSSMPVLEDGLSSGHASDTDNNNPTVLLMKRQITEIEREILQRNSRKQQQPQQFPTVNGGAKMLSCDNISPVHHKSPSSLRKDINLPLPGKVVCTNVEYQSTSQQQQTGYHANDVDIEALDPLSITQSTPPPPAPVPHRSHVTQQQQQSVEAAIKDIRLTLQRTKTLPLKSPVLASDEQTEVASSSPIWVPRRRARAGSDCEGSRKCASGEEEEADTDLETDRLLGQQRTDDHGFYDEKTDGSKKKGRNKEVMIHDPTVLIEGVLFRARYLGSTQLVCEGQPTKSTRMMQAEEAVSRIKAPEGETQPSTEVDLFISTEKIMVLNTDLKEIMMDHALRTISYIADIGDLVVLMARRRYVPHDVEEPPKIHRAPKMICHVFESEEAQFIAQSIGQAFQVAYMEFLKANGIEDHSFVKEMDYQEVLNSQEIFGDELQMFAKKEMQKEVVVPKGKGEILGVVIVESGWGSMLPTVVIANLAPAGPAARCGQLNIGDQIIAINGVSLVGLPLSTCQNYIKNTKNQTVVKLTVVPCAPVVEVKIKRPDTKYQLGFSVQNGVICSLLRGGIAERGGVRVGHRIIEINNQSVVAVPHEKIVNLLATSVGEILMKTMPTSMFRLLTGQETPLYI